MSNPGCGRTTKRELIASRILESESCVKKPKIQQQLFDCPHCDQRLSEKTYKKHKKLFYSQCDGSWGRITPAQRLVSTSEFTRGEPVYIAMVR